jgi:hypothetical protein
MFSGLGKVQLPGSIEQQLFISFALRISASEEAKRSGVDCKVALDRVVVGASEMEDLEDADTEFDHYFIVKEARISVGPSDGECSAPHSVVPRERYFILKYRESNNWQAGAYAEISGTPAITPNISVGGSKQKDRPSAIVEIEGFKCGGGPRQSYSWRYRPKSDSAKTHIEFSTTNPPTHSVSFTVPQNQKNPNALRIKAKAIYERKGLFRRLATAVSARLRLKQDVNLRHFAMELAVTIGSQADYCCFPVPKKKKGVFLVMEVDAQTGVIEPVTETDGAVISTLKGQLKCQKVN